MSPGPDGCARPRRGLYWLWWLIGCAGVLAGALPWLYRNIRWRALAWVTAVFVALMFACESAALHFNWWIWNEAQLLGPKVGLIPLEEFLLYFMVPPVLAILQHGFLALAARSRRGGGPHG